MIDVRLSTIADRVRFIRALDPRGANLTPPLTEMELGVLEARLGGALPVEYRLFVRTVGAIAPELAQAAREAPSFFAWYELELDRALVEWAREAAPRIALDGPDNAQELEAIAIVFEEVEALAATNPELRRTLGYLHLRERRWGDAGAAFAAAAGPGRDARLHLDRARLHVVKDEPVFAIAEADAGLECAELYAIRDELRGVLERALHAAGRDIEALRVLDERAAERRCSFDLHHRLARERLARNDLDGAGAALERAAQMAEILGHPAPLEVRVPPAFEPIIEELRAAGRGVDAEALVARAEMILAGN